MSSGLVAGTLPLPLPLAPPPATTAVAAAVALVTDAAVPFAWESLVEAAVVVVEAVEGAPLLASWRAASLSAASLSRWKHQREDAIGAARSRNDMGQWGHLSIEIHIHSTANHADC